MKQPTIDDIIVEKTITLAPNKTLIKIFPNLIGMPFFPPLATDYLKETIQAPLVNWCIEHLSSTFNLVFRYNEGDPYWSLFLDDSSDVNIFMLRFGANTH